MQSYYLREMQLCFEPIEAWLNFSGFVGDDVVKPKLTLEICLSWVRSLAGENVESHWKKGNLLAGESVPAQFANGCSIWGDSYGSIFLALPSWIPFNNGLILPATALVTNCFRWDCCPWANSVQPLAAMDRARVGRKHWLLLLSVWGGRSWVICFYFLLPICLGQKKRCFSILRCLASFC